MKTCQVIRVHRCHINEITIWVKADEERRAAEDRDPLRPLIERVVQQAHRIGPMAPKELFLVPDGLPKDAATEVARRAQGICRRHGMDICARYDWMANKVVLVWREMAREVCWFSRGRAPAAA